MEPRHGRRAAPAMGSPWMKRFGGLDRMASGWMRIRGTRRRRSIDRGFVLSDHADWPDLQKAISEKAPNACW